MPRCGSTARSEPGHFLVEVVKPAEGWEALSDLTARARSSAARIRHAGTDVRFVRSVYAPESDRIFLVYQAASEEALAVAIEDAGLSSTHVSAGVTAVDGGGR